MIIRNGSGSYGLSDLDFHQNIGPSPKQNVKSQHIFERVSKHDFFLLIEQKTSFLTMLSSSLFYFFLFFAPWTNMALWVESPHNYIC